MSDLKRESTPSLDYGVHQTEGQQYPSGMRIKMEDQELMKLDFNPKEVGEKIKATVLLEVIEVRHEGTLAGKNNRYVELQIQNMELEKPEKKETAKFYEQVHESI